MILASFAALAWLQGSSCLPVPESNEVALCVILRAGSSGDPSGQSGVTHLVEHLLFRRGEPGSLDSAIEALGGRLEATTYRDFIRIWVTVPSEHAPVAVPILGRLLEPMTWTDDVVEQEKRMVLQELRLRELVPSAVLKERLWQAVFDNELYGRPTGGIPSEIAALTGDAARERAQQILRTAPITVVAAGGKVEGLRAALDTLARASPNPGGGREAPPASAKRLEGEGYGAIGVALPWDQEALSYVAGQVAVEALAGRGDSLAGRRNLVVEPVWEPSGAACLVGVLYRSGEAEQVLELVREGVKLSDEDIERARESVQRQWERSFEDVESLAFWEAFARAWGIGDAHSFTQAARNLKPEHVRQILSQLAGAA
ncbi:MAG: insulinase family protein [Armatimonadetes bacterium]|nr:MAG: insulinase family protein [Armatimonadota bacterium]